MYVRDCNVCDNLVRDSLVSDNHVSDSHVLYGCSYFMSGSSQKVCGGWVVVVMKPIIVFSLAKAE